MKRRTVWAIALVGMLVLAGCSGASNPWKEPDAAMLKIAHDMSAGHPEVAWEALPPSYRADIQSLLQAASEKIDPEVWNTSFETLGKLGRILTEKREFILANPMLAGQQDKLPDFEMALDGAAATISTLTESDLADFDNLAQLDVGRFLATTGSALMSKLRELPASEGEDSWDAKLDKLGQMKVTVVEREGDRATLRIEVPGEEPHDEPVQLVEERWVPEKIASSWDEEIDKMRKGLESAGEAMSTEQKQAVLMQLGMVGGVLDRLLATNTAEEFNQQVGAIAGLVMGAIMSQPSSS